MKFENEKQKFYFPIPIRYEQFFIPGKPRLPEVPTIPIADSDNPLTHTITVWDNFALRSAAKEIVIVAHSAGGSVHFHKIITVSVPWDYYEVVRSKFFPG